MARISTNELLKRNSRSFYLTLRVLPRAIRPLADEGMISVERGADRRQRVLTLTVLGRTRLDRARPAWARVQEELVDALGSSRWTSMMSELRIVQKAAANCSTRKPAPVEKKL